MRAPGIVGLVAALALVGGACSGSDLGDGVRAELADPSGAPLTTSSVPPASASPSLPSDTSPTCADASTTLAATFAPAVDLPDLLGSGGRSAEALGEVVGDAAVVLGDAAEQAEAAGQTAAGENLAVLVELAEQVRAGLAGSPALAMDAYVPAYFEHGYAAAALRDLAATANLAPCGEVADLVVGADG